MKKKIAKMKSPSKAELHKLNLFMTRFEQDTLIDTGIGKIAGGYASVTFEGFDDKFYYITLEWGSGDGCDFESYKVDRKTFKLEEI